MTAFNWKGSPPEKIPPPENESSHHTLTTKEDEYDHHMRSGSPFSPPTPKRGSRESSPARSEYSLSPPPTYVDATGSSTATTYSIYNSTSQFNFRIHSASDECVYFAENSAWTPGKPDVTLFRGADKQGCPIVGVARWSHMYSREVKIGLGNPGIKLERSGDIPWEVMTATSTLRMNEHTFHLPNDSKRKPYVWRRTHHVGVEHDLNSLSALNFKLMDGQTGDVVGTFATNRYKSWRKFGKFTCEGAHMGGEEGVLMALLTVLALVERSRRRSRGRRAGAGGGGGS